MDGIILTQLIYLIDGQEATFEAFEAVAIPLISKYGGELLLRVRPGAPETLIEGNMELPYEVHLVRFPDEEALRAFMQDEDRKQFFHLKEKSIRTSILIKGLAI